MSKITSRRFGVIRIVHPKKALCLALILPLLVSCRSKERVVGRNQDNFPVVSEGSAAGVTSTIAAPGESPSLVTTQTVPLTGTNVDTTTSFTLSGVTTTDGGSTGPKVAGSIPAYPGSTATVAPPRRRRIPVEQTTSTREATRPREQDVKMEDPVPAEPAGAVSTDTIVPSPPPTTETSGGREPAPVPPEATSTQ